MRAPLVLIAVTAVWAVTFGQVIMSAIVVAEPAAAGVLARLVRRP